MQIILLISIKILLIEVFQKMLEVYKKSNKIKFSNKNWSFYDARCILKAKNPKISSLFAKNMSLAQKTENAWVMSQYKTAIWRICFIITKLLCSNRKRKIEGIKLF